MEYLEYECEGKDDKEQEVNRRTNFKKSYVVCPSYDDWESVATGI